MASSINVPRTHLIMGLCLPLAVLLGYFVAQPLDSVSLAVVFMVLAVLCVPLFMKWHHPLLVLTWNACANPVFLPGRPSLWMVIALGSTVFAFLARSVNSHRQSLQVPSITRPLVCLALVVLATAFLRGGIGIRSLGSDRYGGRSYFFILAAVCGYFALSSQRIPAHRAALYIGMFFLSGLTALIGDLAFWGGSKFSFVYYLFSPDVQSDSLTGLNDPQAMVRLGCLSVAGAAVYAWLLARYGVRGVFTLSRPWRLCLMALAISGGLISGYRSSTILSALIFACVFCLEGLHRTRLLPIMAALALLGTVIVLPHAEKLPIMVQRALSFIPAVPVNPLAKEAAQASTAWRVEMWKQILPDVPKYFLVGKGYVIDPNDLFLAQQSAHRGFSIQAAASLVSGDYHNGPLSVLIPFGIFGLAAFIWVLVASVRVLYYHHRFGNPALQRVNTLLLSAFVAKILLFVFIFGGLSSDLSVFLGLIGISISLNGAPQAATEPESSTEALTILPERVY